VAHGRIVQILSRPTRAQDQHFSSAFLTPSAFDVLNYALVIVYLGRKEHYA